MHLYRVHEAQNYPVSLYLVFFPAAYYKNILA